MRSCNVERLQKVKSILWCAVTHCNVVVYAVSLLQPSGVDRAAESTELSEQVRQVRKHYSCTHGGGG